MKCNGATSFLPSPGRARISGAMASVIPRPGVRAEARWTPSAGLGAGSGTLLDVEGEIGRVSMSVVLMPLPKPATAAG